MPAQSTSARSTSARSTNARTDGPSGYDTLARTLHWTMAAAILVMFALGLAAQAWPIDTAEAFRVKATLFSAHKTLGLAVLALAVLRILRAVAVPGPRPLAEHGPGLRWLSGTVHWALYAALLATPVTGWLHHAASEGFAPIWWPFGQTLPMVPRSPEIAAMFGALHLVSVILLAGLAAAHVAGALLHHWRDRDPTLMRMASGDAPRAATVARGPAVHRAVPALALWAIALAIGLALPRDAAVVAVTAPGAGPGNWAVETGALTISVRQTNDRVSGRFASWTADILFGEAPVDGRHGTVRVEIDIASLTLGSVTSEALGPAFLDARGHPVAVFEAAILPEPGGGYVAEGTLDLRGTQVPLRLPFTLTIEGDTATMEGGVTLDRRDFGIGANFPDEATVGHAVEVEASLTARRRAAE